MRAEYIWGRDLAGRHLGGDGTGGLLAVISNSITYIPHHDGRGNIWRFSGGSLRSMNAFGDLAVIPYFPPSLLEQTLLSSAHGTKEYFYELGLYNYGRRFYNPKAGRFIGRDPITEKGGLNLYGFVGNNPMNAWDLNGLLKVMPDGSLQLDAFKVTATRGMPEALILAILGAPSTSNTDCPPGFVSLGGYCMPEHWAESAVPIAPDDVDPNNDEKCDELREQLDKNFEIGHSLAVSEFQTSGGPLSLIDVLGMGQAAMGIAADIKAASLAAKAWSGVNGALGATRYLQGLANMATHLSRGIGLVGVGLAAYQAANSTDVWGDRTMGSCRYNVTLEKVEGIGKVKGWLDWRELNTLERFIM